MTQAPSVYADLTVAENLAYFAALAGVGKDRVAAVIEQVDLGGHRGLFPRHYQGESVARSLHRLFDGIGDGPLKIVIGNGLKAEGNLILARTSRRLGSGGKNGSRREQKQCRHSHNP
jgi:hypothetical protein